MAGKTAVVTRVVDSMINNLRPTHAEATDVANAVLDGCDALLGARGNREHEATRKMRNEFMIAWDGLSLKESQRILVLGATNRPFDLDDAVMPRRIYVGLPDVATRSKILKVILAKENLEPGFSFEQLAEATEGYSGSDLKGEKSDGVPVIRPLDVDDFIHSTTKDSDYCPSQSLNTNGIDIFSSTNIEIQDCAIQTVKA